MDYDWNKVDEMVLALLSLGITDVDEWGARAWKSYDWDAMDGLHAEGYISDPKSKAKSVVLSPEGPKRARVVRSVFSLGAAGCVKPVGLRQPYFPRHRPAG